MFHSTLTCSRRKGQRLAQERDAMLSTMTEEEKRAWKEEQQRLELEERKALEEGVLHGQRIAIDINYQEKMTTREQLSLVKQLESVFAPSELVYLSPDGAQSLQQVDSAKVYVVGGFVDRSVNKNQSAMRASLLEVPSVRLPIKEYYPECSNPILNVNTVVEILIAVGETGDWRTSLVNAIPQRKVQHLSNQKEEYDFRRIVDEKTLLSLPITRLTKFEIKQALERYCIQHKKKLTFERNEHDKASVEKKEGDCPSVERFEVKAVVDGTVMGAGSGSNTRIAAAFASWRALKAMGVLDESEAECVSE
ncbi:tRNA (guanine-N(1)-)-methyltransferase [Blastocystis sp. ATCC 50177/Nand II]|uniref:tRNA (guanine(9)-N(1))-methyltransferase n=1 Tax=Blastocystis sp. subtype 1 (strain ATCC 50177 / NandII) TaxID=478820 RepID=A0A196SPE4_BLAHN|nr:tRNA (guanine-N(1)-)-methyltransferase [Blastocystis sp. ATCC 50177/Nand II]